jgi:arylsulfatase A-like enzyme
MSCSQTTTPRLRLLLAALLAASGAASCGDDRSGVERARAGEAEVTGQGVLVIAVDGLRWDHTSLAGYDRETTPSLEKFARDSVVFENAWGVTPSMVGAHVAILAGDDPGVAIPPPPQGAVEFPARDIGAGDEDRWFLPAKVHLLGRHFLGLGWSTAAFVDHEDIKELRGFDRGFREFVEHRGGPGDQLGPEGAFGVGKRFIQWVNGRELDENWFAYLHMNDLERRWRVNRDREKVEIRGVEDAVENWRARPELHFAPPLGIDEDVFHTLPPSRANRARSVTMAEYELRYDLGIRAVDASVARILASVEDFGRRENLTVVIMGSFGTSLGERGLFLRAGLAEEGDLHVPLLIRPSRAFREALGWGAEGQPPVKRVKQLVGSIDIAPTLVDLIGAEVERPMLGASLRPLLEGETGPVRDRLPVRPSVIPGFALIEPDSSAVIYRPDLAASSARSSWSSWSDSADRGEEVSDFWKRWEELIELERRSLHFGLGADGGARVKALRGMQGLEESRAEVRSIR